jgi:hypothetical protein
MLYRYGNELQGTGRANLNAHRITSAQIAFDGFLQFGINCDYVDGAVTDTSTATDTLFMVHHLGVGGLVHTDSLYRANVQAVCVSALIAHHRKVVEIFAIMSHSQSGPVGIVSS